MEESFTDDAEAYSNLISVYLWLEGSTVLRLGQRLLESESEEDLLQSTMAVILEKEIWKRIRSRVGLYRYARRSMVNKFITLLNRAKKAEPLDGVQELDHELFAWLGLSPFEKLQVDLEDKETLEWMKSLFPGDAKIHRCLDRLLEGYKRGEIAEDMKLTAREVTDLLRRLKRERKIQEFRHTRMKNLRDKMTKRPT